ncbi:MAG: alcohol dehydrogenase catalytic domain-containing protein [Methanotrichaceae archaeon]
MKAAVLKAPGVLELDSLPDPKCPRDGALVRVEACSVCGTDIKMLQRGHRDLVYPRIPGHEIVGTVLDIDQECRITEGDLVQVWPGIACGSCRPCQRGRDNECERMKILGFSRDGGFAELIALPKESVFRGLSPVKKHSDSGIIALAEPLACCINGQELTRVSEGDTVLIIGGGPIGCLHAILAELRGAETIIVVEKLEGRIQRIKSHTGCAVWDASEPLEQAIAVETDGLGVDVILIATPEVKVDNFLLKLLAPGGRLCIFSGPRPEFSEETIDLRSMHYRELTMVGAYGCSSRQNRMAVELLASGRAKADWIITKRTSLDRIQDALSHSSERRGLKPVIVR